MSDRITHCPTCKARLTPEYGFAHGSWLCGGTVHVDAGLGSFDRCCNWFTCPDAGKTYNFQEAK
ncbi:MAG: hypothetical protein ACOC8H_00805 [bacterium]